MPAGLLLSHGVVYLLSLLPDERLSFLGLARCLPVQRGAGRLGLYIRLKILETPAFARLRRRTGSCHVPFFELWRTHPQKYSARPGRRYIEGVTFNIFGVFIIAYVAGALGCRGRPRLPAS